MRYVYREKGSLKFGQLLNFQKACPIDENQPNVVTLIG
jgi:hypothetical protein